MKQSDWVRWKELSDNSLLLDNCLSACDCVKRGWYDCSCIRDDNRKWDQDFLYVRKFTPPNVRPVNKNGHFVSHPSGHIVGPYQYTEWLKYGFDIFDKVHRIMKDEEPPIWADLFFRKESDFYGGIYSHFYPISMMMVPLMDGLECKHGVTNDLVIGVDLYETLAPQDFNRYKTFRNKGKMFVVPRVHKYNVEHVHKRELESVDVALEQSKIQNKIGLVPNNQAKLMKKHNKKHSWHNQMHFLNKTDQNFESWYPLLKQTPIWWDAKRDAFDYPPIFKTNPAIVNSQRVLIETTLEKWLETGAIFIIDKKDVDLCTPCVLANCQLPGGPKPDPTKKPRLCHDGGFEKAIEAYSFPCKLENLYMIHQIIQQNDWLTKIDDKRGFHLLLLSKESRKLTCFEFEGRYFAYRVAPFGSPKIPSVFQRVNMCAVNYSRHLGCRNALYLDDRILLDKSEDIIKGVPKNAFCTTALVIASGGVVSIEKSDLVPKKKQEFLGLDLNTETCEISVPPKKWITFQELIIFYLQQGFCTFKQLEKLRGKCVSFILTNPFTKLFIRVMNRVIADLNAKNVPPGYIVHFSPELEAEISEWIKLDFLQMKHVWREIQSDHMAHVITWTDASSFSIGVVIFEHSETVITKQWFFDENIQQLPIYYKEALAILWMLQAFPILNQKRILHFCDNTNVVDSFNNLGSKTERLNTIITDIYKQLHVMKSTLLMKWVSTHYQIADEESRTINYNEEYVPKSEFKNLCKKFTVVPDIDLFASRSNFKCSNWINFGLEETPGCIGFDFFSVNPNLFRHQVLYAFPPKNIINKVATHLDRFYRKHKFLLIFHSFAEMPIGIAPLLKRATLNKIEIKTVIPAETELFIDNQKHWGFLNRKPKATYALCHLI